MSKYRKALVAVAGAAVLVAGQFGLVVAGDVPESFGVLFDGVVALLTAFGVFRVPNDPTGRSSWGRKRAPL
jgi:uncharacterized membrane protein